MDKVPKAEIGAIPLTLKAPGRCGSKAWLVVVRLTWLRSLLFFSEDEISEETMVNIGCYPDSPR